MPRYYEVKYTYRDPQEPDREWKAKRMREVEDSENLRLILQGLKANPPKVVREAAPEGYELVEVAPGSSSIRPFKPSTRGGFHVIAE